MVSKREKSPVAAILQFVADQNLPGWRGADISLDKDLSCRAIASDGSTRKFWRLNIRNEPTCIIAAPETTSPKELEEARSAFHIGCHLYKQGIPVPEILGWHEDTGVLLFEDLGDVRLHDVLTRCGQESEENLVLLKSVVEKLVLMQVRGIDGFDESWCWDGTVYDVSLMIERESNYFLEAFWKGLLGGNIKTAVKDELRAIAEEAEKAPAQYFLHRDFQSRNIMIKNEQPFFIDFQGGRRGPLGYDLASLLIDPYTELSVQLREKLFDHYFSFLSRYIEVDKINFTLEYKILEIQRNLQIVGAFAFLSKVRKKMFFKQFITPPVMMLRENLMAPQFSNCRNLRSLVDESLHILGRVMPDQIK